MKFKLGSLGSPKHLLLAHGEKLGVALVGAMVLYLIYQAVSVKPLTGEPAKKIAQSVDRAAKYIQNAHEDFVPPPPNTEITPETTLVNIDLWKTKKPLKPRLFKDAIKRADPQLFAVEKLEVFADYGPIVEARQLGRGTVTAGRDTSDVIQELRNANDGVERVSAGSVRRPGAEVGPNDTLKGESYVIVTGLVPLRKQLSEYQSKFQNAEVSGDDYPDYLGYVVERADVTDGGKPEWTRIMFIGNQAQLEEKTADYGSRFNNLMVADSRYVHPLLSWPLPPLVGRDFGTEAKHSDIPAAPTEEEWRAKQQEMLQKQQNEAQQQPDANAEIFGGDPTNFRMRGDDRIRGERFDNPRLRLPVEDRFDGREVGRSGVLDSRMRRGMRGQTGVVADSDVDNYLFRLFDFDVVPGRRYQYRVKLALRDPNNFIEPRFLTKEAADRLAAIKKPAARRARVTGWSEPSSPVTAANAGRLLAGRAQAASKQRFTSEPKVTVMAQMFDAPQAAEAAYEFIDLVRGSVANTTATLRVLDLRENVTKPEKDYTLNTDNVIIDIRGGEELAANNDDMIVPAEILVMTSTGQLLMRSELDDQQSYQDYKYIFADDEEREKLDLEPSRRPGSPGRRRGSSIFDRRSLYEEPRR